MESSSNPALWHPSSSKKEATAQTGAAPIFGRGRRPVMDQSGGPIMPGFTSPPNLSAFQSQVWDLVRAHPARTGGNLRAGRVDAPAAGGCGT